MEQFHVVSHAIFKNLSHALELPWEKYLGEMHEFAAMGDDELQIVNFGAAIPNMWSTLVCSITSSTKLRVPFRHNYNQLGFIY